MTAATQLPDRPHLGPSARATHYLFRQPFILVPGVVASAGVAGYLLHTMFSTGHTAVQNFVTLIPISIVAGFGLAITVALPGFFLYRFLATPAPTWTKDPGEEELLAVNAVHYLGAEGRGGTLHVTTQRLVFVPYRFNVQLAGCSIRLDAITKCGWARVVAGPGVGVTTAVVVEHDGVEEAFGVPRAEDVAKRIAEARG